MTATPAAGVEAVAGEAGMVAARAVVVPRGYPLTYGAAGGCRTLRFPPSCSIPKLFESQPSAFSGRTPRGCQGYCVTLPSGGARFRDSPLYAPMYPRRSAKVHRSESE